jgi:hypothetical protein
MDFNREANKKKITSCFSLALFRARLPYSYSRLRYKNTVYATTVKTSARV